MSKFRVGSKVWLKSDPNAVGTVTWIGAVDGWEEVGHIVCWEKVDVGGVFKECELEATFSLVPSLFSTYIENRWTERTGFVVGLRGGLSAHKFVLLTDSHYDSCQPDNAKLFDSYQEAAAAGQKIDSSKDPVVMEIRFQAPVVLLNTFPVNILDALADV